MSECATIKMIANTIEVLSTIEGFPVSGLELALYLMQNCDEAKDEGANEFLSVTVRNWLDRMRRTGLVLVKVNGFVLTEKGRWVLLRNFQGKTEEGQPGLAGVNEEAKTPKVGVRGTIGGAKTPKVPGTIQEVRTEKVQGPIQPGTLFAANSEVIASFGLSWGTAELLMARDGKWSIAEFKAKVVGKAPTLIFLESKGKLCSGYAAVAWPTEEDYVIDESGASFVFSIKPKVEQFPLVDKDGAVFRDSDPECISFGDGTLQIWEDGEYVRKQETYAVPRSWVCGKRGAYPQITRFEVWLLTA
jgi:hypothetical protein